MYKLINNLIQNTVTLVFRDKENLYIPFSPANTDYQTFKLDLAAGASLKDAEGNLMTAEQITTFLQGLA
jgi:hypothetical protein